MAEFVTRAQRQAQEESEKQERRLQLLRDQEAERIRKLQAKQEEANKVEEMRLSVADYAQPVIQVLRELAVAEGKTGKNFQIIQSIDTDDVYWALVETDKPGGQRINTLASVSMERGSESLVVSHHGPNMTILMEKINEATGKTTKFPDPSPSKPEDG